MSEPDTSLDIWPPAPVTAPSAQPSLEEVMEQRLKNLPSIIRRCVGLGILSLLIGVILLVVFSSQISIPWGPRVTYVWERQITVGVAAFMVGLVAAIGFIWVAGERREELQNYKKRQKIVDHSSSTT